jgi:hypothetical protein
VVYSTSVPCSSTPWNLLTQPALCTMVSLLSESQTACYTTYRWHSTNRPPSSIVGFVKLSQHSNFLIGAHVNDSLWQYVWGSRYTGCFRRNSKCFRRW